MKKVCSKCGVEKELGEFYRDRQYKKSGREGVCKECRNSRHRKWAINNPEYIAFSRKRWKINNPLKNKEIQIKLDKRARDKLLDYYITRLLREQGFPITPETIQLKREQIMVFRALKSLTEDLNERTN